MTSRESAIYIYLATFRKIYISNQFSPPWSCEHFWLTQALSFKVCDCACAPSHTTSAIWGVLTWAHLSWQTSLTKEHQYFIRSTLKYLLCHSGGLLVSKQCKYLQTNNNKNICEKVALVSTFCEASIYTMCIVLCVKSLCVPRPVTLCAQVPDVAHKQHIYLPDICEEITRIAIFHTKRLRLRKIYKSLAQSDKRYSCIFCGLMGGAMVSRVE